MNAPSTTWFRRSVLFALVVATLALSLARDAAAAGGDAAYREALRSTGLIFDDSTGGTCWVIDAELRLGITSYQVVREKKSFKVYFPDFKNDQVVQDFAHYRDHQYYVTATVIMADARHDLALLEFDHLPTDIVELLPAIKAPAVGDPLYNLGYDARAGKMFVWHETRLSQLSVPNLKVDTVTTLASPVYETKPSFRDGFSGGPVLNAEGRLVGVVSSSKVNLGTGYIIKVDDVLDMLDASGVWDEEDDFFNEPSVTPEAAAARRRLLGPNAEEPVAERAAAKPEVQREFKPVVRPEFKSQIKSSAKPIAKPEVQPVARPIASAESGTRGGKAKVQPASQGAAPARAESGLRGGSPPEARSRASGPNTSGVR